MSLLFTALIALVHPVAGMLLFVVWLIWGWVFDRSDKKTEAEHRNHGFPP